MLFAVSWTPCAGPTLSVVLSLALTSGTAVRGAVLAFLYGLGLGIPFIIVAFAFQRGMTAFQFARRHAQLIARIGGGLLVLVGLLEVSGAWNSAITWLKLHWVGSYTSPLWPAARELAPAPAAILLWPAWRDHYLSVVRTRASRQQIMRALGLPGLVIPSDHHRDRHAPPFRVCIGRWCSAAVTQKADH